MSSLDFDDVKKSMAHNEDNINSKFIHYTGFSGFTNSCIGKKNWSRKNIYHLLNLKSLIEITFI